MSLGRDCLDTVRIPDNQISVGAHCDTALPWVQVEDFSCVCAGHSNKLVLIHLASHLGNDKRRHCISQMRTTPKSRWQKHQKQIPNELCGAKSSSKGTELLQGGHDTLLQLLQL